MACCGDTPTLETLAAVTILRKAMPEIKIRVINVVDLMKLEPSTKHPHGLTDAEYDALFTKDKPIIFAFHGYHTLIHELTYRRTNRNIHVYGSPAYQHHTHECTACVLQACHSFSVSDKRHDFLTVEDAQLRSLPDGNGQSHSVHAYRMVL